MAMGEVWIKLGSNEIAWNCKNNGFVVMLTSVLKEGNLECRGTNQRPVKPSRDTQSETFGILIPLRLYFLESEGLLNLYAWII